MSSACTCLFRLVDTVVTEMGGLHIAVNNAGMLRWSAAEDTKQAEWDATFDLNSKSVFICCQVRPIIAKHKLLMSAVNCVFALYPTGKPKFDCPMLQTQRGELQL